MSIQFPSWISQINASYYNPENQQGGNQALWSDFLSSIEDPAVLARIKANPETIDVKGLYLQFLQGKLKQIYISESQNALSPKEIESRYTIFQVYKLVVNMLKVLQECLRQQAALLQNYTNLQAEWTKMLTQTPVYGPTSPGKIRLNLNSFSETTLGYANMTIRQTISSCVNELLTKNLAQYQWNSPFNSGGNYFSVKIQRSSDNRTFILTFGIGNKYNNPDPGVETLFQIQTNPITPEGGSTQRKIESITSSLTESLDSAWKSKIETAPNEIALSTSYWHPISWKDLATYWSWTKLDSELPKDPSNPNVDYFPNITKGIEGPAIGKSKWSEGFFSTRYGAGAWDEEYSFSLAPGDYSKGDYTQIKDAAGDPLYTDEEALQARQASQTYRSEINASLMQYMESTKAYRSRVANAAQITQNMITQTNDAITAQTDLITSLMQTLSGLIAAIFR